MGNSLESEAGQQADLENSMICKEPNKFASTLRLELVDQSAIFHGYQAFILTQNAIRVLSENESDLPKKQEVLASYFNPHYLKLRTVLDLGANAGFYSFWALLQGASKGICVEIDKQYADAIRAASEYLGVEKLKVVEQNVADWNEPADVTLALALVHWIYSCTALLGSLDAVVGKLAQLTKYMLIVEWIEPSDSAIEFFHHLSWNADHVQDAYTLETFEAALSRHFVRYKLIGTVSPSRKLYVAFHSMYDIDLSGPLPFILPLESIIYNRLLIEKNGIEYWSRVYDYGGCIYKQTTLDLAKREGQFLSQLTSEYFPRLLQIKTESTYSLISIEKIDGSPLSETSSVLDSQDKFCQFIGHLLNLLEELQQQGITHRDICPENILVRDEKPVLIDFGWAISEEHPYFTPVELNHRWRSPDGTECDIYSVGKVLQAVKQDRYPALDPVIELMTAPEISLRVTDIEKLRKLFALAVEKPLQATSKSSLMGKNDTDLIQHLASELADHKRIVQQLLEQLLNRNRRLSLLAEERDRLKEKERIEQNLLLERAEKIAHIQQQEARLAEQAAHIQQQEARLAEQAAHIQQQEAHIQHKELYIRNIHQTHIYQLAQRWWMLKQKMFGKPESDESQ